MSNPNEISVWSPEGEGPFEMSRANARDLTTHAGWSFSPPQGGVTAPVVPQEETNGSTPGGESRPSEEAADADEGADAHEGTEEGTEEEGEVALTSAEQFEGMDRDAVVAYLAKHFPDFKPHHLAKVDSLVAKAVELATA